MDETSISFIREKTMIVESKGSKNMKLRKFKGEKKRVTVCLSITA